MAGKGFPNQANCPELRPMSVIGGLCQGHIRNAEDFTVAGRRLPLSLAWATLLATWFGAGTLLTQADAVRNEGLSKAALDPWGAGVCLLIAGLFFAKPLWEMKLLTLPDFFRRRFGSAAELFSARGERIPEVRYLLSPCPSMHLTCLLSA